MALEDVIRDIEPTRQFSDEVIRESLETALGIYLAECVDPIIRTGLVFQDREDRFIPLPQKLLTILPDNISPQVIVGVYEECGTLYEMYWLHLEALYREGQIVRIMQRMAEAKQ